MNKNARIPDFSRSQLDFASSLESVARKFPLRLIRPPFGSTFVFPPSNKERYGAGCHGEAQKEVYFRKSLLVNTVQSPLRLVHVDKRVGRKEGNARGHFAKKGKTMKSLFPCQECDDQPIVALQGSLSGHLRMRYASTSWRSFHHCVQSIVLNFSQVAAVLLIFRIRC